MVPRYARPQMTAIWEPEARFRIWFEIEAHATDALADLGVVPKSAAKALWDWWATNPTIDVAAIDAIEAITKHDVIAFLTWVAEQVGDERVRSAPPARTTDAARTGESDDLAHHQEELVQFQFRDDLDLLSQLRFGGPRCR